MQARKQLLLLGLAVLVLIQAASARPWLGSMLGDGSSRLSGLQEQLRQNQRRRLIQVDDIPEAGPTAVVDGYALSAVVGGYGPTAVVGGYGPGYGQYGGSQDQLEAASRNLLAPTVSYDADQALIQAVVQAGASWDPDAASITLNEAGQRAASSQQFYEEGDEVMVGPVPVMPQA